jgi:hypothetical protein
VHLDEMIDRENGERNPNRRCGGCADPKHGQPDDADRKNDLQIDIVVGRTLDFVIERLYEVDDRAHGMGVAGKVFGLRLDTVCQLVELGIGAVRSVVRRPMHRIVGVMALLERIVEFVVAVGIVVKDNAAGCRIDDDLFNPRYDREHLANLLQ